MTDLLTIAEAQIAEKQYKEIESIKKRLDADKEIINQAIELVQSHTLYKKVVDSCSRTRYVLATEEMLKEDYLREPKYGWQHGIQFKQRDERRSWNTGILNVNGETYYDIHFALQAYEHAIDEKIAKVNDLNKTIHEYKDELANLEKTYPSLKQAVTEWMEWEKQKEREYYEKYEE